MDQVCNKHIREALEYAKKLTILADDAEGRSEDDGCILLYGIVRDCAYKIRGQAEHEREIHKANGIWA